MKNSNGAHRSISAKEFNKSSNLCNKKNKNEWMNVCSHTSPHRHRELNFSEDNSGHKIHSYKLLEKSKHSHSTRTNVPQTYHTCKVKNIAPFNRAIVPKGKEISDKLNSVLNLQPWVMISIEQSRSEEEIDILWERPYLRRHLPSIPHCWSWGVLLVPWIQHFGSVLTEKWVGFHSKSDLHNYLIRKHSQYYCFTYLLYESH